MDGIITSPFRPSSWRVFPPFRVFPDGKGEFVDILVRWIHIAAASIAVGGLLYARLVVWPALDVLGPESRANLMGQFAARLRSLVVLAVGALLFSGTYNLYRTMREGVSSTYHMVFGLKFLLALHVFTMLFLLSKPPGGDPVQAAKRKRWLTGAGVSGLIVLALGAWLRILH